MLASDLKRKLASGGRAFGTMMTFDFWPGYLEAFKQIGLDFVLLDCEHGAVTTREVEELCRTARLVGLPAILRPVTADFPLIRKYARSNSTSSATPCSSRRAGDAVGAAP
jgi:2-keto-3-deoxy-L-rhamnonate aldolase RhmA